MKKSYLLLIAPIFLYSYTIDFESSLDKTINNNKDLKAKKLEIEKSKFDLKEARGYSYGSLVFSENIIKTNHPGHVFGLKLGAREASFSDFGFDQFLSQMGNVGTPAGQKALLDTQPKNLNEPEARTNFETKLTYKVPIFTGFKLKSAKKMAKLQLLAKKALYNYNEKSLGLEVLKAYNGAVAAKEFIKATQKAKEATSLFVDFANELFKEGLVTSIDVKQSKVYDMGVDSKMIEAKNSYELALSYLRFLTSDELISDVGEFKMIYNDASSMLVLQDKAQQNREDYKWMKYNTDTMKSKIDFDSSNKYPILGAQIEYGYNDDKFNTSNIDEHDYYLGALGLSYTIFDGAVTSSKSQKAKIQYKQTMNYYNYMKDGIKLEVEKNFLNLQAKNKILKQKIKAYNLSNEVLEQASQMYKNHLINMTNLLTQQANEQKANAEMIMAKYEKSLAEATLKVSLGEGLK